MKFVREAEAQLQQMVKGSAEELQHHVKVMVARHPFKRLVSAYLSKIGPRNYSNHFFDDINRKIVERYREKPTESGKLALYVSFYSCFCILCRVEQGV